MRVAPYALAVAAVLAASGCQCVRIPDGACFAGERCPTDSGDPDGGADAGGDAGPADAGKSEGGNDAGTDAGSDAGVDAGVDAGDPNRFPQLGICDTWDCVQTSLAGVRLDTPPGFSVQRIPFSGVSSLCKQQYRGGVWLPDGRVLAIPYCADRFLLIDPVARTAAPIGPALPFQFDLFSLPRGNLAGGALGCDGAVWAVPEGAPVMMNVSPADGGFSFAAYMLPLQPNPFRAMGAVLGEECDAGYQLWTSGKERVAIFEPFLSATTILPPPSTAQPFFRSNGMLRTERTVWVIGVSDAGTSTVWDYVHLGTFRDFFTALDVADAGPFQGGALGADHSKYFIDPPTGDTWVVFSKLMIGEYTVVKRPGPRNGLGGYRWPAFRGDGFIYALGQSLLAISEDPDGGVFQLLTTELGDAGPEAFGGLVVTTSGMVAIPSEFPDVLLLVPDAGQSAPRSVLLSPFFNKL